MPGVRPLVMGYFLAYRIVPLCWEATSRKIFPKHLLCDWHFHDVQNASSDWSCPYDGKMWPNFVFRTWWKLKLRIFSSYLTTNFTEPFAAFNSSTAFSWCSPSTETPFTERSWSPRFKPPWRSATPPTNIVVPLMIQRTRILNKFIWDIQVVWP